MASMTAVQGDIQEKTDQTISRWPSLLLVLVITTELFTPYLIWKGYIPSVLRWISDATIVLMLALVPLRMLAFRRMPPVFWLIVFLSIIGVLTSILSGQGLPATIWGWWLMFQFPFIGLFSYLQPAWPKNFTQKLLLVCLAVVCLEVLVQLFQFMTGERPGDNLAGTFGQNGTGDLVLFLILVLCFFLGQWLHTKHWVMLVAVIILGLMSSVLGEMKLFYLSIGILAVMGLVVFLLQGKQLWKIIPITLLMGSAVMLFIPLYNRVVATESQIPLESYLRDPALVTKYLTFVNKSTTGTYYYYDIGRNYAVVYGWDKISQSPQYLYLGYGLGARSESKSLGIIGRALEEGDLGVTSGTSLLVILQETGIIGVLVMSIFFFFVIYQLVTQIRRNPTAQSNSLRYGLIFFTILWPLWLWYNAAWTLRVPMLIYWSILGYLFSEFDRFKAGEDTRSNKSALVPGLPNR